MDYSVRPDDFTDAGNAEVFRVQNRGLLLYTDALGWLEWTGKRWERGEHGAITRAETLTRYMLEEALLDRGDAHRRADEAKYALTRKQEGAREALEEAQRDMDLAQAYLEHTKRTRQAPRLMAMLELAKHDMVVPAVKLDADPFLLNTPAGEVDLRTGALKEHSGNSPWHYCTRITRTVPGHTMEGTALWYSFLETVTCGDGALARFLQTAAGMALVGKVYHEGILLACGSGRNGKSTFFNALASVLGDYAGGLDVRVLTSERQNRGAALATLRGRRLVLASELEQGQRLSASVLKQIASTDRLVVEEKYKAPETVEQTHTLVLFTNHLPRVGSSDLGTWRRLTVVPFRAEIPQGIPNYAQTLVEKAGSDILSWAIEGARQFLEAGCVLHPPEAVDRATREYQAQEDWLGRFLAEGYSPPPGGRVGARELYQSYRDWAQGNGEYPRSERTFAEEMKGRGFGKHVCHGRMVYDNLQAVRGEEG